MGMTLLDWFFLALGAVGWWLAGTYYEQSRSLKQQLERKTKYFER